MLSFCTGYMANLALLTALGDASATIFADKLNHASLVDGALLAKAPLQRYPHGRLDLLASQLGRCSTPIKLIVGLRLGCINHALLSAEAIRARGLRLAGWVANTVDAGMLHRDDNLATLRDELGRRHQAPCLGVVPRLANPDPAAVATHLDDTALRELFGLF